MYWKLVPLISNSSLLYFICNRTSYIYDKKNINFNFPPNKKNTPLIIWSDRWSNIFKLIIKMVGSRLPLRSHPNFYIGSSVEVGNNFFFPICYKYVRGNIIFMVIILIILCSSLKKKIK